MDCSRTTPETQTDLLRREDEMVMDELKEQIPSAFATDENPPMAMYLCIRCPPGMRRLRFLQRIPTW